MNSRIGILRASNSVEKYSEQDMAGKHRIEHDAKKEILDPRIKEMIDALNRNYDVTGNHYRDRDTRKVLITDKGDSIKTRYNDSEGAAAIVKLAQSKGWDSIKVKGTDTFKKAVWEEAKKQKLDVSGYTPSLEDETRLKAYLAKDAQSVSKQYRKPSGQDKPVIQAKEHSGVLLEHGKAPYKNDPSKQDSYYAVIKNNGVEKKIWGAGIQNAIKNSGAIDGEKISLKMSGRESVKMTGTDGKTQTRVQWEVKRSDDMLKIQALANKDIENSNLNLKSKELLKASIDKELVKMQEKNKLPDVKLYESDPQVISLRKQEISRDQAKRRDEIREQKQEQKQEQSIRF